MNCSVPEPLIVLAGAGTASKVLIRWDSPGIHPLPGGWKGESAVWGPCCMQGCSVLGDHPLPAGLRLDRLRRAARRGQRRGRGALGEPVGADIPLITGCVYLWVLSWPWPLAFEPPGAEPRCCGCAGREAGLCFTVRSLTCGQGRYSISRQDHISSLKSRQIEMAVDPSSIT